MRVETSVPATGGGAAGRAAGALGPPSIDGIERAFRLTLRAPPKRPAAP